MKRLSVLHQLRNSKCKLCPLHKGVKTVCLIGKGPVPAKIMFIGEGPGEEEDIEGDPFVGRSGKLLDSVLANIDPPLNRKKIFITNVVKCRPPFNAKPSVNMMDICSNAYLRKEIEIVKPELIVCLGGTAASSLTNENFLKVGMVREKLFYTQGPLPHNIPFIVTYHPAATFHQPELLEYIVEDLEWTQRLLAGELPTKKNKHNYKWIRSLREIPGIDSARWLDLDLETDGLDPFLPDKEILSLQISIKEGEGYYLDWTPQVQEELRLLLKTQKVEYRINGHNIKHDLKWLRVIGKIPFEGQINDTIQNIHLLDENFPHKSLDVVLGNFTELKGHKTDFTKLVNQYIKLYKEKKERITAARERLWKKAFRSIPIQTRVDYGCGDADGTGRLRRYFKSRLRDEGLIPLHNLMMNVTKLYVDMECNGVKIDLSVAEELEVRYTRKLNKILDELDSHAKITHTSYPQLKTLLYGKWKLPSHRIKQGKKWIEYSTGKEALELIIKDDIKTEHREYLKNLLEYRKDSKLYGTYLKGLSKHLRGEGLIHGSWNLTGTDTGRTSCKPALQQIPRTGDIKQMFCSRFRDGVLMQIDISQGELRIGAHVSEEPTLIKLFKRDNVDIHRATAALSLGKKESKITDDERYNFKQVNFAVLYGSGVNTIAQEMKGVDLEEAREVIKAWHKRFSRWREHVREREAFIIKHHYIRNPFGRYRRLYILDPSSGEGRTQLRQGINAEIQGGLSDWNKLVGYNLWMRCKEFGGEVLFVLEGHDAWVLDMRRKHVDSVVPIVKEVYEHADTMTDFGFVMKVPMRCEIKVGKNWKEMEEVNV